MRFIITLLLVLSLLIQVVPANETHKKQVNGVVWVSAGLFYSMIAFVCSSVKYGYPIEKRERGDIIKYN